MVPAAKTLTDEESREVSFAAGRILKHVAQARLAIKDKKRENAARHIDQGLKLVAIVNSVLPHYQVKTEIKSGDLVYTDDDDIAPKYVTIFDELDRRDILSPLASAKNEAKQKDKTNQKSADAGKKEPRPLVVSHADIEYTALKLNIGFAERMLNAAKKNLADSKTDDANGNLLALQAAGVIFEYDEIDLPLEEAADNLKLAEIEMKEGRQDAAKAALHVAIDELKAYEKQVGEKRAAEVKELHQEIDKLAKQLGKGKLSTEDHAKHASTISTWWHKATKWFKK